MRIEKNDGPRLTRDYIADKIARAIGVEASDLAKPIPQEVFHLDVDIFAHLRRTSSERDHYYSMKLLKYTIYHLAEALERADLKLGPDWQEQMLSEPRPSLPFVPTGPLSISHGEIDGDDLLGFMTTWHSMFGEAPFDPEEIIKHSRTDALRSSVEKLPVFDRGKINSFWLEAYLRKATGATLSGYKLHKLSFLDVQCWIVTKG
jgi:hypothetical protein